MSDQLLKIAIMGCGKMACNHLNFVTRMVPRHNIALCDREIIKARLLGELYGIDNLYDSLDGLVGQFHPDIFHIVTPPATHKQLANACMRAGGHVYIEKPVCLKVSDFDEVEQTASECKTLLCGGHQKIFEGLFRQAKRLVQDEGLGRVIHLHAYDSGPYLEMEDQGLSRGWWSDFTGGMFLDVLPHIMSMFTELVGDLKLEHSSIRRDNRNRPSELHGFLSSGSSPVTCSFHVSFTTKFLQNYIRIECEKGLIVVNHRNKSCYVIKRSGLPALVDRLIVDYTAGLKIALANTRSMFSLLAGRYDPYEGTGVLIENFYEAVRNREESPTPMESVRKVVELCEQTAQASFGGLDRSGERPIPKVENPRLDRAEILVTGASGFIGTHFVRRLLDEGKQVRAAVRRPISEDHFGAWSEGALQIIAGDLLDAEFVMRACEGIECVYHLAAATKGDLFTQVEGTCIGTRNLLQAIDRQGVKRLVYVSSVSILDQTNFPKDGPVDDDFPLETHPLKRGAYTYSKLKAEEMVRAFEAGHEVEVVILRPGIVWGPGSKQLLLQTHFSLGSRVLVVLGDAGKRLPLIYVGNLVDALIKAGDADMPGNGPINIVDPSNPTQKEYLELLADITGERRFAFFIPISTAFPLFWVAEKVLGFMMKRRLDICYKFRSKSNRAVYLAEGAQSMLDRDSRVPFSEGLTLYHDWLKLNGENNR